MDSTSNKPTSKRPVLKNEALLESLGWSKEGNGYLGIPFNRSIDVYKKEGSEVILFVSWEKDGQFLNTENKKFLPISIKEIEKFEKDYT